MPNLDPGVRSQVSDDGHFGRALAMKATEMVHKNELKRQGDSDFIKVEEVSSTAPAKSRTVANKSLRVLSATDVAQVVKSLSPTELLENQRLVFKSYTKSHAADDAQAIQVPLRTTVNLPDHRLLVMPARMEGPDLGTAIKLVSVPSQGAEGLPGTTVVMDEKTGSVKAVVNARELTALRNAAGSAVAYELLPAPKQPRKNLVVFGTGAQANSHIRLFAKIIPSLTHVVVVARKANDRLTSLLKTLQADLPSLGITSVTSTPEATRQAVHDANLIVCCTPSLQPLFNSVDVTSGTHITLIGSYRPDMHEIQGELLERAGKILVDSKEHVSAEAGEVIDAGWSGTEKLVEVGAALEDPELVQKLVGSGDVTIFKSVGLGIQDVAITSFIVAKAEALNLGTIIKEYD